MSYVYDDDMKKGYLQLWASAEVRPERIKEVDGIVDKIMAGSAWTEYQAVESRIGVPAFVVGCIHLREASMNFKSHLHNGDPLSARTVHVPKGRIPAPAEPPFKWDESADDALTMPGQHLDAWHDWTLAGIAFIEERYNGFGYRIHGVNSPYLWGFSTAYTKGMYTEDSVWSSVAVNGNPGTMTLLRRAVDRNLVTLPDQPIGLAPHPLVAQAAVDARPSTVVPDIHTVFDHIRMVMSDFSALGLYHGALDGDPGKLFRAACAAFHTVES